LVVRWWLEAFGKSLSILPDKPVRAVLVGSPLNGTSLAAPDKLQGALSLLSWCFNRHGEHLYLVNWLGRDW